MEAVEQFRVEKGATGRCSCDGSVRSAATSSISDGGCDMRRCRSRWGVVLVPQAGVGGSGSSRLVVVLVP